MKVKEVRFLNTSVSFAKRLVVMSNVLYLMFDKRTKTRPSNAHTATKTRWLCHSGTERNHNMTTAQLRHS